MACAHSTKLANGITVPCGRCVPCRIKYAREWAYRIMCELPYHANAMFATLTYDDQNLPKDLSVKKDELASTIKRLRKYVDYKIKYYGAGEYGEKYGRPHYHLILFGIKNEDRELISKAWTKGFVHIGNVTYDSARYVADYVQKKSIWPYLNDKRNPPFCLQSNGFGKKYFLENAERLKAEFYDSVKGKKLALPRYAKQVLGVNTGDLVLKWIEEREEEEKKLKKLGIIDYDKKELWRSERNNQEEVNIKAKTKLVSDRSVKGQA